MKRSWIGFALLILLLLSSALSAWFMDRMHEPVKVGLQQAAQCAMEGNWEKAGAFFRQAEE